MEKGTRTGKYTEGLVRPLVCGEVAMIDVCAEVASASVLISDSEAQAVRNELTRLDDKNTIKHPVDQYTKELS